MAQATFKEGERVLCYETDPGKVNKIYRAAVRQVFIFVMEHGGIKYLQVDRQQKSFLVHFRGWGHRWDR